MQTSRFTLGLIATLAMGLGYTLSSSPAVGYPAGAAVGLGTNPVVSFGGSVTQGDSTTLTTVPADSDLVITDVFLGLTSEGYSCHSSSFARLTDETGALLAEFAMNRGEQHQTANLSTVHSLSSGIPVEAGRTLTLVTGSHNVNCGDAYYAIRYTLTGYYAQP